MNQNQKYESETMELIKITSHLMLKNHEKIFKKLNNESVILN